MKIIYKGGQSEIIEKKSRFIATVFPIKSKEEALDIINQIKKKYWDARHNCFAYVLGVNNEIQGCSDDGEPSGTAGKPMLDVITGEKIHNTLVIVTRYFGGTLLGTGGLVRAYQSATKEGILNSTVIEQKIGKQLHIVADYNSSGKIQYLLAENNIDILDVAYTENVEFTIMVENENVNFIEKEIIEKTNGKSIIKYDQNKEFHFAKIDQKVIVF